MKKQLTILSLILATAGFSAFGQGYITFTSATSGVWDEFTTPGIGIKAPIGDVNVAFLWSASGTDLLPAVGSQFGLRGGAAVQQVATNGVSGIANGWTTIATMLGAGWSWGHDVNGGAMVVTANSGAGGWSYNASSPFQVVGTTAGNTIEMIAVAWDVGSGTTPGSSLDIGWSNPFNYLTGANASDPNGTVFVSSSGANQFGIAMIPEPSTLALAGLGGLSLLLFRRRK